MQTVWVEVTTTTQRQLVRLLDDDTTFIQTEGGAVVLDLRPIVIEIGDQVAVIGKVAERLPESSGRIAIIEESQLETAQTATKILRSVADWMWLVALVVAALAVWLARGRRRLELRAISLGLLVVGLLLLAVRRFAGDYLVEELAKDDAVKPAAGEAWDILRRSGGPGVGLDHPRCDHARRCLVRGRDRPRRPCAPRRSPGFGEALDDLWHRGRRTPRAAAGRSAALSRLAVCPDSGRPRGCGIEVVRNSVLREAQQHR